MYIVKVFEEEDYGFFQLAYFPKLYFSLVNMFSLQDVGHKVIK